MNQERDIKRLSAVLAADVAGYTRLVEENRDSTVSAWKAARSDIIEPVVENHGGRIVKLTGDGFLAEFGSAQDAVECGSVLQDQLADNPLEFRMGIGLGDIVDDGQDIHGEGVNIAARIEALADAGGICISGMVHEAVRNQVSFEFENMGEQSVKNVSGPVQVFRVKRSGQSTPPPPHNETKISKPLAIIVAALVLLGGAGLWWQSDPDNTGEPANKIARQSTKLPIVVLPFANFSNDKEQEYFADGMTDDLITDLSKISGLSVIARNSAFTFKGRNARIEDIASELGVRYVLEGSVRREGGTIRINAQLIDAKTNDHVWGETFDRPFTDIFSLQDEVAEKIVSNLSIKLTPEEKGRIAHHETNSVKAHDLVLRARQQESFFNKEASAQATALLKHAISVDPGYAEAYARLSILMGISARLRWVDDFAGTHEEALKMARKAVELDPDLPLAYFSLGRILARPHFREYTQAIEAFQKTVQLDPNHADSYANLALVSIFIGNAKQASEFIATAMKLNPLFPFWYLHGRAMARYFLGNYDGAVEDLRQAADRNPRVFFVRYWLAAALAMAGQAEDAEWEVEEWQTMGESMTRDEMLAINPITYPPYREKLTEGLKKAGYQ